jgi:protein phosphatase
MLPAVEFGQKSDPGRDPEKHVNEDASGYRETKLGHLCVVCDGMGGHLGGREASNLALQTIVERVEAAPTDARPSDVLRDAVALANQRVFAIALGDDAAPPRRGQRLEPHARPGSTVVAILLHAGGAEVAHVGDSRCYLVHGSQIFQVTKDHSMVQELVDAGFLTPSQAASHPNANQITRALGMGAEVEVDVRPQALHVVAGDSFVLCSDGLTDLVEPPEILQIVGSAPPAQAAGQLVDLANARGGHDNITVAILRAREGTTAQPSAVSPTLAQTQPPDRSLDLTLPAEGVRTLIQEPAPSTERQPLVAPVPGMLLGVARIPDEAPPSSDVPTRRRPGMPASVLLGLALAAIGILILIAILYMHFAEHGHHHKSAAFPLDDSGTVIDAASAIDGGAP